MDDFSYLILLLLRKSPLILVLVGGLVFAFIRWRRHRRSSLLASIGIGIYLIQIFVLSAVYYLLPALLTRMNIAMGSHVFTVIQIVDDLVYGGVLILLLAAAFSERAPKAAIKT